MYGGGDYGLAETEDQITGDTLALFVVRELDDDCDSIDEGIRRMERAKDDLDAVIWALNEHKGESK